MKMKVLSAAVAVLFTLGIATSCGGNKKATVSAEAASEQCTSGEACCKADSLACDSTKTCCEKEVSE